MFEKIDIGIKTFLRDEQLFNAIDGIRRNYPGARMIIADCGEMNEEKDSLYADLERDGHKHIELPFDAGFGRMSNAIVAESSRPYLLIGSDDFEFDAKAAEGLSELQSILDFDSGVDIASGRVNNRAYEFFLEINSPQIQSPNDPKIYFVKELNIFDPRHQEFSTDRCIAEKEVDDNGKWLMVKKMTPWFVDVDLTVNYSLIRMDRFRTTSIHWDRDVKIGGGEHGAFFFDCKQAGLLVVCAQSVNINEQKVRNSPRYNEYRSRANSPERPCFDKRNIVYYELGDGRIDYRREK